MLFGGSDLAISLEAGVGKERGGNGEGLCGHCDGIAEGCRPLVLLLAHVRVVKGSESLASPVKLWLLLGLRHGGQLRGLGAVVAVAVVVVVVVVVVVLVVVVVVVAAGLQLFGRVVSRRSVVVLCSGALSRGAGAYMVKQ